MADYPRSTKPGNRHMAMLVPCAPENAGNPPEPNPQGYSHRTDDDLAMMRSKGRTHDELAADQIGTPSVKEGVSSRQAMTRACHNDQHPWGKYDHDEF